MSRFAFAKRLIFLLDPRPFFFLLFLEFLKGFENGLHFALYNIFQIMPGFFYPMIGNSILRVIIGSGFFRTLGPANLLPARLGLIFLNRFFFGFLKKPPPKPPSNF